MSKFVPQSRCFSNDWRPFSRWNSKWNRWDNWEQWPWLDRGERKGLLMWIKLGIRRKTLKKQNKTGLIGYSMPAYANQSRETWCVFVSFMYVFWTREEEWHHRLTNLGATYFDRWNVIINSHRIIVIFQQSQPRLLYLGSCTLAYMFAYVCWTQLLQSRFASRTQAHYNPLSYTFTIFDPFCLSAMVTRHTAFIGSSFTFFE